MACTHTVTFDDGSWSEPAPDSADGCFDCRALGEDVWAHLRLCLSCGHVACCDSSPHRHATAHATGHDHPVVRSYEPGEAWRWCYADERIV
ncbi:UBP-type zinc finger domain-containing protein [Pseudonocardia abyssalis]|uniref:UBP-type zinc finger domain-containing protein n=1 Tax=Pseudonocardia abyssalis TaxID=2792008 RepID=A0ABS6UXB3_9PSEU|nr:UBP-type zinc finger domain-containing protein [Pseudonocardia abyssalis]MBW0118743.1 UBP-type zinc finger domain-containing protein [Pseudonocardia abyssalis]MBW0136913.1 UBP-type zinc finger domain-containing protein [Pseudonocardia abyssalis]